MDQRFFPLALPWRGFWRSGNGLPSNSLSRLPGRSRQNCVYRFLFQSVPGQRQRKEQDRPFLQGQTPARAPPRVQSFVLEQSTLGAPSSPVKNVFFSLPPCTAHSLFFFGQKTGAPAKAAAFVGRGGRNGAGGVLAVRRGRSRAEFLPTTWGVQSPAIFIAGMPPARQGGTGFVSYRSSERPTK